MPEQSSAGKKEGWGKPSLYKLENSQQVYSIQAFSASTCGFCHKSEKISSETITTNGVFRPKNIYPHHNFGTNRGKDEKDNF